MMMIELLCLLKSKLLEMVGFGFYGRGASSTMSYDIVGLSIVVLVVVVEW